MDRYTVVLELEDILGGFPGSIDAMTAFLQNPAMAKRVPAEAREEFIGADREFFTEDQKPKDVLKTGFRMVDGVPHLGGHQIKAMLQQAAKQLYDANSKPSIYSVARAITYGLDVTTRLIPIQGGVNGGKKQIAQIMTHPRYPQIRIPSVRERDQWIGGTLTFEMVVATEGAAGRVLSEKDFLKGLFETGGVFIGLGTDRGYGHGRFMVKSFEPQPGVMKALLEARLQNPARKGVGRQRE